MPDLHRHAIKDTSILDPKEDRLELLVEHKKSVVNQWIDEMARIRDGLPIPPHLCYFTTREDAKLDKTLGLGSRPPPRPEQTVIIIADNPEYRPYFEAVFAYEDACMSLKHAHRRFLKSLETPKKRRKKAQKRKEAN